MKGLFVVFHGFSDHSGISKKIRSQCEALARSGIEMHLCYTDFSDRGTQRRMIDDLPVQDFGHGLRAKLSKRLCLGAVTRYILEQGIDFLYVRHDHNANPVLIDWFRRLHRAGVRIVVEIPTYPYDAEFARSPLVRKLKLAVDRLFRRRMARYVERFVTFTDEQEIFDRPTLCISNGFDPALIPLKRSVGRSADRLRLLAVANIHFWHGFDRAIEGLARYYALPRERKIELRIVGDGPQPILDELAALIRRLALEEHVRLVGPRSGEALDAEFDACEMGIASLGRHRNGISRIKTLKNREYAARGIPFVYSETDSDFDAMPYVMKVPADDTPLDMEALVAFYDRLRLTPSQIRATVEERLSWDAQMGRVADYLTKTSKR